MKYLYLFGTYFSTTQAFSLILYQNIRETEMQIKFGTDHRQNSTSNKELINKLFFKSFQIHKNKLLENKVYIDIILFHNYQNKQRLLLPIAQLWPSSYG